MAWWAPKKRILPPVFSSDQLWKNGGDPGHEGADGGLAPLLSKDTNLYAQVEVPGTIDHLIDEYERGNCGNCHPTDQVGIEVLRSHRRAGAVLSSLPVRTQRLSELIATYYRSKFARSRLPT